MPNDYCWVATHVGLVRERNEDAFALSAPFELTDAGTWQGELPSGRSWAVVADGMGGHAAGEVASRLAVDVLGVFLPTHSTASKLSMALASADRAIGDAMLHDPSLNGMGTTVCGVVISSNVMSAFNVGDSRIYVLERGELRQLSEDHVVHGHMLTQCLGGSSEGPKLEPSIVRQRFTAETRVLLCTDGLTDLVSDEHIRDVVATSHRPAEELIEAALDAGGHDNITAVVLQLEPL